MRTVMDVIMSLGFVLFMVWIIRGYHANKYEERYGEKGDERKRSEDER
ncbi:hypothetical protein [Hydrogenimonas sp.]